MMAGLTAGQSILSIFAGRYLDKVVSNSNLAKSRIGNWLQSFTPKYYKKEIQQSMVNNFLSNALGVAYDKFVLGVPGKIIDVEKTYEKVENEFFIPSPPGWNRMERPPVSIPRPRPATHGAVLRFLCLGILPSRPVSEQAVCRICRTASF